MTPQTDSGIAGDQNTKNTAPTFVGQVYNAFPGTVAGLQVYIQFNGLHGGSFTIGVGPNGRGVTNPAQADVTTTTDATGKFTVVLPQGITLLEGFQRAQVVVVGQPDVSGQDGLSYGHQYSLRIDTTPPQVTASTLPNNSNINVLQTVTLSVVDNSNPATGYLATPGIVVFPAIDPASASNVSNYSLTLNANGTTTDESQYHHGCDRSPPAPR